MEQLLLPVAMFVLIAISMSCTCATMEPISLPCNQVERASLLNFKHKLSTKSFKELRHRLESWVGEDCCNWKGVGCDNITGHITKLDLRDEGYNSYGKVINLSPFELKYLTYLVLSGKYFGVSGFPEFLGSMTQLQYINLSSTDFRGDVPQSLGNLTKLVTLDLTNWGSLMADSLEWTFKLKNLEYLDLSGIDMSQGNDSLDILSNLPSLSVLNLARCGLNNSHLVMRNSTVASTTLQHLDLSFNFLSGPIPHFIQSLYSVKFLDLSFNNFNSSLPSWFGRKLNLTYLSLSNNSMSCTCATMEQPSFTCNQVERTALLNFKHNFSYLDSWVGEDCCSWKGVGCDNVTGHVIKLDLRVRDEYRPSNGEVSPSLLELKYLTYLDLSGNYFSSFTIPEFFGSIRQLQYLNLSQSYYSGEVPASLGNLTQLVTLDLRSWGYTETIKSLNWAFKLKNLQYLDLSLIDLSQATDSLNILHHLPSLSVLNLASCSLGNSHLLIMRNSTIASTTLKHLDLSSNLFSGPIPHFIQNLSSIRHLDLSSNQLNSSLPSWFGNNLDLTYLDLSYNQFSSSIPSWLGHKRHLQFLSLSNNLFSSVDEGIMNIIGSLCELKHFDLSYNQLQEDILEFDVKPLRCNRFDLQYLYMQNNNMSGQLPTIKYMLSLQELNMSHNSFEVIPASFGELFSLESVDLSYNKLGVVRQIHLSNLSSLRILDISSNSLDLDISSDWLPPFQLQSLQMLPCNINSQFPKWLLGQQLIFELDLSNTGIYGSLPYNFDNAMSFISSLRLTNNSINGSIPRSLCKLAFLQFLDLSKNKLSGKIPDCWVNSQIVGMELSSNKLSGHIPNSLTEYGTLQLLSLSDNLLEGELPLSLSKCTKLKVLDVGKNNLHGEVPSWNGADFTSLQILILRENKFNGIIPPQLCTLHMLQIIDLASNNLVGTIPSCFGHFEGMGYMQHSNFSGGVEGPTAILPSAMDPDEWTATEVIKGEEREYTKILHLLVNMALSCNNLVGVIPANITSLSLLLNLNLAHNHLMGTIPREIEKMKSLESLDLSFNNISGSIPESISSLDSLTALNLSFNNLQGQIPTGRHLQTIENPSIYMGNPGLCGDLLPKKCFGYNNAHPPTNMIIENEEEDNKHENMWFYLVIMLGFASGFWGVIGTLVVKRRWRHAYFLLADDLANWLYVRIAVKIVRIKGGH